MVEGVNEWNRNEINSYRESLNFQVVSLTIEWNVIRQEKYFEK